MIKKISVFALLLSLLLALGVPEQANAEEETKVIPAGSYKFNDEPFNNVPDELIGVYVPINFHYLYQGQNNRVGIKIDTSGSELGLYYCSSSSSATRMCYVSDGVYTWILYPYAKEITVVEDANVSVEFFWWFASNVEDSEGLLDITYSFDEWCTDAGLNCSASSNESDSVVPFWYEPDNYNYIVRKTLSASSTSGVYQMTMLQKTDGAHYPYYFEVNDIGYLGVAGAFSDTSAFTVRNFYYDAEGNGWKHIERFDVSTLPFDNTNVTFDENVVFIYSDTDIYADREASSIWQAASTEYYNVDVPEPEVPTPTPTTVPSSGTGRPGSGTRPDTGGQATGGGGLDFIINLFTLIWTKICSIPMAVDGYSISLQQIIIYGALVSIVGGFIMHFIFGRK